MRMTVMLKHLQKEIQQTVIAKELGISRATVYSAFENQVHPFS